MIDNTVTVVTLTRRRSDLLFRAIESVQQQTFSAAHLCHMIMIDDCPETEAKLEQESLPSNVCFYKRHRTVEEYSGPGRSAKLRNESVKLASSKWLSFLDDDNEFFPNHIESLVECAVTSQCRAVHSHMQFWTRDGKPYTEALFPWIQDFQAARREYERLRNFGVYKYGSNIAFDRVDPIGTKDPVRTADTGEWLLERSLLLQIPFPTEYSEDDWSKMTTEDVKLMNLLVEGGIKIACTGLPTLKYYLGGYSNTRCFDR